MLRRRDLILSTLAMLLPQAGAAMAAGQPIVAPIRLSEARILIDATLNGRGPYPFVIDTGAQLSGVRDELAKEIGLKTRRRIRVNRQSELLYQLDELVLGGAVRQAGAVLVGLSGVRLGGQGLLAAGMLTTFDSELDLGNEQWKVWPTGGADRTGFVRLESDVRTPGPEGVSSRIYAEVLVGTTKVRPLLDTGMPTSMVLENSTGRAAGLWDDTKPYAPVALRNFGRPLVVARLVRAPSLSIGPLTYQRPLVAVRPTNAQYVNEIMGLPFLRTLDLSFDRADKALWIRHNGKPALTTPYGGSGIWVDEAKGGAVRVGDVGTGSPAALAGVRVGDIVEGSGGLGDVIQALNGPLGATVTLKLRRDGQPRTAMFTPKAYL